MKRKSTSLRFPTITQASEFLVQGHIMRRNVLAYKAPPNNQGYDLICVHPDPAKATRTARVQVKSRYASYCERFVPLAASSLESFDFLVAVFLNVGNFAAKNSACACTTTTPECYVLPRAFVQDHHRTGGSWEWPPIEGEIDQYKDDNGFELIANALGIERPSRPTQPTRRRPKRRATARSVPTPAADDALESAANTEDFEGDIEDFEAETLEAEIEAYIKTHPAKVGSR